MNYLGSKNKFAQDIVSIINEYKTPNQTYIEPFCGGCNIIDKIHGKRIAADAHKYLIAMWKAIESGWLPPMNVTGQEYEYIRAYSSRYAPELVGYVGFNLSFSAMWWGGYRKDKIGKRNYSHEAYNNIIRQSPHIKGIEYFNRDYLQTPITTNAFIYCDPPYHSTATYYNSINHVEFWAWCRRRANAGDMIIISEYEAPSDFISIWEEDSMVRMGGNTQGVRKEHLYIYKPQYKERI